jgi:ketosteroid isomerase-like protein
MKNQFKKNVIGCLFAITLLLLTIHCSAQGSKQSNEKIVRAVYTAYEKKDWNMLKSLFADGFTFTSPMDDHIDLKEYKVRCWPNSANIKSFHIDKLVVDGDDAFVLYRGWTMDGREMENTEYFKLKNGKIKEFTCFFGPGISFPNNKKK